MYVYNLFYKTHEVLFTRQNKGKKTKIKLDTYNLIFIIIH